MQDELIGIDSIPDQIDQLDVYQMGPYQTKPCELELDPYQTRSRKPDRHQTQLRHPLHRDMVVLLVAKGPILLARTRDLLVLVDVHLWPVQLRGELIPADDDARLRFEEAVDVLERACVRR